MGRYHLVLSKKSLDKMLSQMILEHEPDPDVVYISIYWLII